MDDVQRQKLRVQAQQMKEELVLPNFQQKTLDRENPEIEDLLEKID